MHRAFIASASSHHSLFSATFITNIAESDFRIFDTHNKHRKKNQSI